MRVHKAQCGSSPRTCLSRAPCSKNQWHMHTCQMMATVCHTFHTATWSVYSSISWKQ
jgi:hypothetical protein